MISARSFLSILLGLGWISNVMALELTSTQFQHGQTMPKAYTCDGSDISPPLAWQNVPEKTRSFALIMDDPDAPNGTWDHWLIYNIPAAVHELPENATPLPQGAVLGKNSWDKSAYQGPCPPDREHRYIFKLYALDTMLTVQSGLNKEALLHALKDHVLASTELMAKYQRSK